MVAARLTIGGLRARDRQPLLDLRLQLREIVAGIRRSPVERVMLAAVDDLLRREGLDLFGKLGRSAVAEFADALDEEGLADREGRRQRVIDGGRFDTPAVPKTRSRSFPPEAAVARRDLQVFWAWAG